MVSNSLHIQIDELVGALARISQQCADEPEYREARATLPEDWPI